MICWNEFDDFGVLGQGAYGVVHKVRDKKTKQLAAIKLIDDEANAEALMNEYRVTAKLWHPNVINLSDAWMDRANPINSFIVYELMELDLGKFLTKLMRERSNLLPQEVKSFAYQILLGLAYCHDRNIIHGDIKPANFLLDGRGTIKIADFGCATTFQDPPTPQTTQIVTLPYRCPEVLMKWDLYGPEIDMWAFGCVFSELFTCETLFQLRCFCDDSARERCELLMIFKTLSTPTTAVWGDIGKCPGYSERFPVWTENILPWATKYKLDTVAFDLLKACLTYDPKKRISARDACKHPFFLDLDKSESRHAAVEDGGDGPGSNSATK